MLEGRNGRGQADMPTAGELVEFARREAEQSLLGDIAPRHAPLPDCFPGYKVVKEVHRGGQGVVYEAVQRSPKRKVAIKVMRVGPFAGEVDQVRFEREANILARVKHPNIVAVIDAGVASEMPYFAMEFVEGQPLDAYLQENRNLTVAELLRLFLKICHAVHAAHLQGVTHRDIKPSNILIDITGEPHILDFGLSRQTSSSSEDGKCPSITYTGQFVGSLPWSSPEQANGGLGVVDIRTDVYSLGVLLFWALTGQFPYEVHGPLHAVTSNITSADSPRPSTIHNGIDDDVDTIVLKCLAKDRERRYQSAGDLACDIERYLQGNAIDAKRDSTVYVLSRMIRRHRKLAVALGSFLVLLILSVVVTSSLYFRSTSAERDARRRYEEVRQLARSFIFDFDEQLRKGPTAARNFFVSTALAYLNNLLNDAGKDANLLADVVAGYVKVADVQGNASYENLGDAAGAMKTLGTAKALAEDGVNSYPESRDLLIQLATVYERIGDMRFCLTDFHVAEAIDTFRKCLVIREKLVSSEPGSPAAIRGLTSILLRIGNMELELGRRDNAFKAYTRSVDLRRRLVELQPTKPEDILFLARGYRALGDAHYSGSDGDAAMKAFGDARAILDQPDLFSPGDAEVEHERIRLLNRFGHFKEGHGDHESALKDYLDCEAVAKAVAQADPENIRAVEDGWHCAGEAAMSLARLGRYDEAIERAKDGLKVAWNIAGRSRDRKGAQEVVAYAYQRLGQLYLETGDLDVGLANFMRCMEVFEALREHDSEYPKWQHSIAGAFFQLGATYREMAFQVEQAEGDGSMFWRMAQEYFAKSLSLSNELIVLGHPPQSVEWRGELECQLAEVEARIADLQHQ